MKERIILDLCGGTGDWSKPYKEAGYDVRVVTIPENDVRTFKPPNNVYGILAAPPCTMFSFARMRAKTPRDLKEGMECVRACLDIIWKAQEIQQDTKKKTTTLKFWALENPYFGLIKSFLGKPAFVFDPWEFGDGYQKKTALWGNFKEPKRNPTKMIQKTKFDIMKTKDICPEMYGKLDRKTRRSITPPGYAKAFFEANK